MALPCGARSGGARFSQYTEVLSKNLLADRGAQGTPAKRFALGGGATKGQMALVTFAETKVTRARGGTRVENNIAFGDTILNYEIKIPHPLANSATARPANCQVGHCQYGRA